MRSRRGALPLLVVSGVVVTAVFIARLPPRRRSSRPDSLVVGITQARSNELSRALVAEHLLAGDRVVSFQSDAINAPQDGLKQYLTESGVPQSVVDSNVTFVDYGQQMDQQSIARGKDAYGRIDVMLINTLHDVDRKLPLFLTPDSTIKDASDVLLDTFAALKLSLSMMRKQQTDKEGYKGQVILIGGAGVRSMIPTRGNTIMSYCQAGLPFLAEMLKVELAEYQAPVGLHLANVGLLVDPGETDPLTQRMMDSVGATRPEVSRWLCGWARDISTSSSVVEYRSKPGVIWGMLLGSLGFPMNRHFDAKQ